MNSNLPACFEVAGTRLRAGTTEAMLRRESYRVRQRSPRLTIYREFCYSILSLLTLVGGFIVKPLLLSMDGIWRIHGVTRLLCF